jgi:cholesterol oxidase
MGNTSISFQFSEVMQGYISFEMTNYQHGYQQGKDQHCKIALHLKVMIDDIDAFIASKQHQATITGYIESAELGGQCPIELGYFNLFSHTADLNRRQMRYRLFFKNPKGNVFTLSGHKDIQNNVGLDLWSDTTTLYSNIFSGQIQAKQEASTPLFAAGIVRITLTNFIKQLNTLSSNAITRSERIKTIGRFGKLFAGNVWDIYAPRLTPKINDFQREIPLHTTQGVKEAEISIHPFHTEDQLAESLLRFKRAECDDVVVLIHGLTTSSDMFIMPEHYNLVQYLLDHHYTDVWTLDYRMSNRFSYNLRRNQHNLDDIALFDYPAAFKAIRGKIGENKRIHVICHCLGSVSFMMSLFAKQVGNIHSVIANSVALTPRISTWSKVKLTAGPFLCDYALGIEYLNPYWRRESGWSMGKILSWGVSLFHKECNVPECHMLSFMWGSGCPALYKHENLHDVTHQRSGDLYGGVSVNYYRHIKKMVSANNTAIKFKPKQTKYQDLPDDYFQYAAEIKTPVLFITGEENHVFTDSNIDCYQRLNRISPKQYELHVFPNYGHQDIFMGKNVHQDIFPRLLEFLNKNN